MVERMHEVGAGARASMSEAHRFSVIVTLLAMWIEVSYRCFTLVESRKPIQAPLCAKTSEDT